MAVALRGEAARIDWGYYVAASLGAWTLDAGTFVATVQAVDTFRASQSPLTLVIRQTRHPIAELQISGGTLTARLGPQESPHALAVCPT
jgi:hypothetical protein